MTQGQSNSQSFTAKMENHLIQQLLKAWQAMALQGPWYQDAFLVFMCMITVVMLFFTGTVLGLFLQSMWGIFITHRRPAETES